MSVCVVFGWVLMAFIAISVYVMIMECRSSTLNYLSVPKSNTATYGTDVSLLPLQNCGTPYLAISVTLKTCALLKLVLRHGFLNSHLI